jgi:hypothetical protein
MSLCLFFGDALTCPQKVQILVARADKSVIDLAAKIDVRQPGCGVGQINTGVANASQIIVRKRLLELDSITWEICDFAAQYSLEPVMGGKEERLVSIPEDRPYIYELLQRSSCRQSNVSKNTSVQPALGFTKDGLLLRPGFIVPITVLHLK